jgi:hypothetical protein
MSVDFFKPDCHRTTVEPLFGLCDNGDKSPAYIDSVNKKIWIASVINKEGKRIAFTAVDNCIEIYRENGDMESRCDVMMTCEDLLYLVELKSKVAEWQSEGIGQLESTIISLINNAKDFYYSFRKRKAYVANKRHPRFHRAEIEDMERFRNVHKIRLYLEATILID